MVTPSEACFHIIPLRIRRTCDLLLTSRIWKGDEVSLSYVALYETGQTD